MYKKENCVSTGFLAQDLGFVLEAFQLRLGGLLGIESVNSDTVQNTLRPPHIFLNALSQASMVLSKSFCVWAKETNHASN